MTYSELVHNLHSSASWKVVQPLGELDSTIIISVQCAEQGVHINFTRRKLDLEEKKKS
jgi:hypothetical protein